MLILTLNEFIAKQTNQVGVGDTDANKGECVGLVEVWTDNLGLPHDWGNAKDLLTNAPADAYQVIYKDPNNLDQFPLPGDVLCLDWGLDGHTGVVTWTNGSSYTLFEQNNPLGSTPHIVHHLDYNGVIGWLHPRVAIPTESTPVEPPPTTGVNLTQDEQNALQVIKDHFAGSIDLQNQPFGNLEGYANTLTQDAYRAWKDRPNLQLQLVLNQADLINAKAALAKAQNQINDPPAPVVTTPSLPTNPATKSGGFFAWLRAFLG